MKKKLGKETVFDVVCLIFLIVFIVGAAFFFLPIWMGVWR